MIKKLALALAAAAILPVGAFADTEPFGAYIQLNVNGSSQWYGVLEWGTNIQDFQGTNFGNFDPSLGDTLSITGGSVETFKNDSSDVTGATLYWRVYSGSPGGTFDGNNLPFFSNAPFTGVQGSTATGGGDQSWRSTSINDNVLANLDPGTYTLEIYFQTSNNEADGGDFVNAGGLNYQANFTVVPEPSSLSLLAGPAILGAWFYVRRRRRA